MDDILLSSQTEALAAYSDRHELYDLFQGMLEHCIMTRPDDVVTFFLDYLKVPTMPSFVIIGPPGYSIKNVASKIARMYNAVNISASELLKNAISRGNSYGTQAKPFVEKRQLVPDNVMTGLLLQRLKDPDIQNNGYVLSGYPRTKEQARALQRAGIMPSRVVAIDVPDNVVIDTATGIRTDPITLKAYHLAFDPPPNNPSILERLVQRSIDTEGAVRARLDLHRKHIESVTSCYPNSLRKFSYPDGFYQKEEEVIKTIVSTLSEKGVTRAPREYKIIVGGLPGSGKTSVCEMLHETLGLVHVSVKNLILEQISAKNSHYCKILEPFLHKPHDAPKTVVSELIIQRLKSKECIEKGWVLDGYPTSVIEAEELKSKGITPNRLFWMATDRETCTRRLVYRRFDPITGAKYNILTEKAKKLSEMTQSPQDAEEAVNVRMERNIKIKGDMEKFYGYRTDANPFGIMQEVPASGMGEADSTTGRNESKQKMFELVTSMLLQPIPLVPKKLLQSTGAKV